MHLPSAGVGVEYANPCSISAELVALFMWKIGRIEGYGEGSR